MLEADRGMFEEELTIQIYKMYLILSWVVIHNNNLLSNQTSTVSGTVLFPTRLGVLLLHGLQVGISIGMPQQR